MGDPYPEAEAQRLLDELKQTAALDSARIDQGAELWRKAATELKQIAVQLGSRAKWNEGAGRTIWLGEASGAATKAFDALAAQFDVHAARMSQIGDHVASGAEQVRSLSESMAMIGDKLKAKKHGGMFGTGIGPDVGPDVAGAVSDIAHDPKKLAAAAMLPAGIVLGYEVVSGTMGRDLSREDQFNLIKATHERYSAMLIGKREAIQNSCPESATGARSDGLDSGHSSFIVNPSAGGASSGVASGGSGLHPVASGAGSSHYRPGSAGAFDHPTNPVTGIPQPLSARMDGSSSGVTSVAPGDPMSGYDLTAPSGGGGSSSLGSGLFTGTAAAVGGIGAALGGALGAARLAGSAAVMGDGRSAGSGTIGGTAPGSASSSVVGVGGAGARPGGGMGMMGGGMGAGGAGAGGDKQASGARYGQAPQLSDRGKRRRRGAPNEVLGAGSRREAEGDVIERQRATEDDEDY